MISRLAVLALPIAVLAACQTPPPAAPQAPGAARQGRVDAERAAYCRQRAEEIYVTQNREALYRSDSRDSPFSGAYVPSVTSRGLSDRYAQDRMISDCIRNTGERTDPTAVNNGPTPSAPAAPAQAAPAQAGRAPAATSRALPPPPPRN